MFSSRQAESNLIKDFFRSELDPSEKTSWFTCNSIITCFHSIQLVSYFTLLEIQQLYIEVKVEK